MTAHYNSTAEEQAGPGLGCSRDQGLGASRGSICLLPAVARLCEGSSHVHCAPYPLQLVETSGSELHPGARLMSAARLRGRSWQPADEPLRRVGAAAKHVNSRLDGSEVKSSTPEPDQLEIDLNRDSGRRKAIGAAAALPGLAGPGARARQFGPNPRLKPLVGWGLARRRRSDGEPRNGSWPVLVRGAHPGIGVAMRETSAQR